MKVTIIIDDDGEETNTVVDLDDFQATPAALRLIAAMLDCSLARAYYVTVTVGINVLISEYAKVEAVARKAEFHQLLVY